MLEGPGEVAGQHETRNDSGRDYSPSICPTPEPPAYGKSRDKVEKKEVPSVGRLHRYDELSRSNLIE
jgi:hypothetical protein